MVVIDEKNGTGKPLSFTQAKARVFCYFSNIVYFSRPDIYRADARGLIETAPPDRCVTWRPAKSAQET